MKKVIFCVGFFLSFQYYTIVIEDLVIENEINSKLKISKKHETTKRSRFRKAFRVTN